MTDSRIPHEYQSLWVPTDFNGVVCHLTTQENWAGIQATGHIQPRDPAPRNWAGMTAIFLANPDDLQYIESFPKVLAHVKKKHPHTLRLHIKTKNKLWRSLDPERLFQIMSLDPIDVSEIVKVEAV